MQEAYYLEIDEFPLQGWLDCHKGDFTATRRAGARGKKSYFNRAGHHSAKNDAEAWGRLYDDFLKKVGLGEDFEELVALVKEKIQLSIDYLEEFRNGKRIRSKLNAINAISAEITAIKKKMEELEASKGKKPSITSNLRKISKKQGYHIAISQLTTLAYFDLLKAYNAGEL
jgi:hypothetical protein